MHKNQKLKALFEQRAAKVTQMKALSDIVVKDGEVRAFTEEEQKQYDALAAEVRALDDTIAAVKLERSADITDKPVPADGDNTDSTEQAEERAFVEYIRTGIVTETRSDHNWTAGDNGAVIPTSIANKIIDKITEISPVYARATKYNIGGTLTIPYYDETSGAITVGYADEFTDGDGTAAKFSSITLGGFLARCLTKVSKRLINNSNFDLLNYIVGKVAEEFVKWMDGELLSGTSGKITGLSGATQVVTAAAQTAITADELIDLQDKVVDAFQGNSCWIMSRATRTAIRKLKDGDGRYLLNRDANSKWGYTLFGKDVYVSDKMPEMAAGKTAVIYGDLSGLAIKTSENISIDVLREKYAEQHAYGVVAWMEIDAKIENQQKIAVLKMHA